MKWETMIQEGNEDCTQRLSVPGGWIVCRLSGFHIPKSLTSIFIEDHDHSWKI